MASLFDPLELGPILLKNRIIMAPMTRGRADDAGVQPAIAATYYEQRAGAGLIISESVHISPMGKPNDNTPGVYTPAQIDSWKRIADAVHEKGGRIFMQLIHGGRVGMPEFLPGGAQPVSASAVQARCRNYTKNGMKDCVMPRALSVDEIRQVVHDFALAAQHAMAAGMDGVELHAAYGYLVHQFLGTNTNIRTDAYGGSFENRSRFLFELIDALLPVVGDHRLGIRFSPGASQLDMEDAQAAGLYPWIFGELNRFNLAYVHVVQHGDAGLNALLSGAYHGVYFVNGGFTRESGNALLAAGEADAVVYGKPFIANPDLPGRFREDVVLREPDIATLYARGEKGYTDYH